MKSKVKTLYMYVLKHKNSSPSQGHLLLNKSEQKFSFISCAGLGIRKNEYLALFTTRFLETYSLI